MCSDCGCQSPKRGDDKPAPYSESDSRITAAEPSENAYEEASFAYWTEAVERLRRYIAWKLALAYNMEDSLSPEDAPGSNDKLLMDTSFKHWQVLLSCGRLEGWVRGKLEDDRKNVRTTFLWPAEHLCLSPGKPKTFFS